MTHMENMDHKIYSCGGPYFISVYTILTPVSFKPLRTQDSLRTFFFFLQQWVYEHKCVFETAFFQKRLFPIMLIFI